MPEQNKSSSFTYLYLSYSSIIHGEGYTYSFAILSSSSSLLRSWASL